MKDVHTEAPIFTNHWKLGDTLLLHKKFHLRQVSQTNSFKCAITDPINIREKSPLALQMQNSLASILCRDHQLIIKALKLSNHN